MSILNVILSPERLLVAVDTLAEDARSLSPRTEGCSRFDSGARGG